jgi:hypothetical protein
VGGGVPGPGHRAVRAHPDAGAGLDQQHAVPGHRLRVRRPADRVAVPGARAGRRRRAAGLVRPGPAVPVTRSGLVGRR